VPADRPPADAERAAGRTDGAARPVGRRLGRAEFTTLLALSMALAALGIDLMLPAFPEIREGLGQPPGSTAVAGIVTTYLLGLALGQLVYGPVSDRYGRRRALYLGYGVYALGALAATISPNLTTMLAARFVWGLGAAGPRTVTLAVIRDSFEGDRMSRAMSFVMAVFILVPILAPTLGAALVSVVSWRWLFAVCFAAAAAMALWALRLPETLRDEHRLEDLRFGRVLASARYVVSDRQTAGYTLALTALYGVFTSYLASSENIFGRTFDRAGSFPLIFGALAAVMGLGMLANARIVGQVGARRLSHLVLVFYVAAAALLVALAWGTDGRPPLWAFLVGLAVMLVCHALLIPNFNTVALAPMGHVAGTAAAIIGTVPTAIGALLGSLLDRAFDGTVLPVSVGFFGYGVLALLLVLWAERGRLFQPLVTPAPGPATPEP
jgi:MFS transporter, DHA1 family, multidrug resistance protein